MKAAQDRPPESAADWHATWEDNHQNLLDAGIAATPAQRLAWLEEALELAYKAGALPTQSDVPGTGSR